MATSAGFSSGLGWSTDYAGSGCTNGGNGSVTPIGSTLNHLGIFQIATSGSVVGDYQQIFLGMWNNYYSSNCPTYTSLYPIAGSVFTDIMVAGQDASTTNAGTQQIVTLGLADTQDLPAIQNGAFFQNTSTTAPGHWQGIVAVDGTLSAVMCSSSLLDVSFHKFQIQATNDSFSFAIDGIPCGTLNATPDNTVSILSVMGIQNSEAAAKLLDVDYFGLSVSMAR